MAEHTPLHISIPLFFTGLLFGSIGAIITNGIFLSQSSTETVDVTRTLQVVFSSIFTLAFLITAIISWIELIGESNFMPVKISLLADSKLNKSITTLYHFGEVIEQISFSTGAFLTVIGISTTLTGLGDPFLFFGIVGMAFGYIKFRNRQILMAKMRSLISSNEITNTITLAKKLGVDHSDVIKAVSNLITFESFPARYDFENDMVYYNSSQTFSHGQEVNNYSEPVVSEQIKPATEKTATVVVEQSVSSGGSEPVICPYCGEESITDNPKFCVGCGASMSAAK